LNIGFEYEQLGFHIFCKINAIMTKKKGEGKYQCEKKRKKKRTIYMSTISYLSKDPSNSSNVLLTLH
jgi:hypothetical protein